jgi:hypothetical protein
MSDETGGFLKWHGFNQETSVVPTTFIVKNKILTKIHTEPRTWTDLDMRFGTWNARSLYRTGYLMTVSRELSKYNLHLVKVHEVRLVGGSTEPAGEHIFFYGKGNENHELGTGFFVLRGLSLILIGCHI